jgi:hypothetical protein
LLATEATIRVLRRRSLRTQLEKVRLQAGTFADCQGLLSDAFGQGLRAGAVASFAHCMWHAPCCLAFRDSRARLRASINERRGGSMKHRQLEALVAALAFGATAAVSAQPATTVEPGGTVHATPAAVGASGRAIPPEGTVGSRECTGLIGDRMTECIERQQSEHRSGMARGGGTGTGQGNGNGATGAAGPDGNAGTSGSSGNGAAGSATGGMGGPSAGTSGNAGAGAGTGGATGGGAGSSGGGG